MTNDVDTFWEHYDAAYKYGVTFKLFGLPWEKVDMVAERAEWPRHGWWRSEWNELPELPPLEEPTEPELSPEELLGLLPTNWSSLYERITDSRGIF